MNKLTDKIEIRISHTEKARLSELATDEGKSVSELVRGLVRRYVDLNTSTRIIRRRCRRGGSCCTTVSRHALA